MADIVARQAVKKAVSRALAGHGILKTHAEFTDVFQTCYRGASFALVTALLPPSCVTFAHGTYAETTYESRAHRRGHDRPLCRRACGAVRGRRAPMTPLLPTDLMLHMDAGFVYHHPFSRSNALSLPRVIGHHVILAPRPPRFGHRSTRLKLCNFVDQHSRCVPVSARISIHTNDIRCLATSPP